MVKIYRVFLISLFIIISIFSAPFTYGAQIAGQSAQLSSIADTNIKPVGEDIREQKRKVIETVLRKYNSPLADSADSFVTACLKYNLNCYLLPSIAGLESTFGKFIAPGSYNPFGWGGGYIMFNDWNEAIDTVAAGLRTNYIDKGAESIEEVGRIYSESTTWSQRVRIFINEFERAEREQKQLQLALDTVQ